MTLDIVTAFLYGEAVRALFIELPESDPESSNPTKLGRLRKSLYGTRDAPQRWAIEIGKTLAKLGFRESTVVPSMFVHEQRDLSMSLHVDDFLVCGEEVEELVW